MLKTLRTSGWLHALFVAMVAYPLGNIAARVGLVNFNAHPIAYTSISMLATSIWLMLVARPGPLGNETLKHPETWLYGVLTAISGILSVGAIAYVSATEVSMLLRISTIMVFLMSFTFLGHRVSWLEWLSLVLISAGIVLLLAHAGLPPRELIELSLMLIARGLVHAIQKLVSETHKTNRVAETFHQNVRVTALVMAVTSLVFMTLFLSLAYIKSLSVEPLWPSLPELHDFLNFPMFLITLVGGALIHAPAKYCEFYATKKISAKYFLAVVSLQPIFTFGYEFSLSASGITPMDGLGVLGWAALILVIAGSVIIALSGFKSGAKSTDRSFLLDPRINTTIRQTIDLTLTFAKGSHPKAAKLIGIQPAMLQEILADRNNELQFTRDLVRTIQRNFAHHVAMADPLTGLANRLQFTTALAQKLSARKPVHITLIDLNKFKPVNDTYGHAAGDALLQLVAKRLQKANPRGATIARLGGDEFAIFTTTPLDTKKLQATLATTYKTKYGTLTISASVGTASSPKDGKSPESLLAAADKRMYNKKSRERKA